MNYEGLLKSMRDWERKPGIVLLDIDGCCVDIDERFAKLANKELTYEQYINAMHTDKPILAGMVVYSLLIQHSYLRCIFITSRRSDQRTQTQAQLQTLFGADAKFELWMRDSQDQRPDHEFKLHTLVEKGHRPEEVVLAFDDRPSVIGAYRAAGIAAYQTAVGY